MASVSDRTISASSTAQTDDRKFIWISSLIFMFAVIAPYLAGKLITSDNTYLWINYNALDNMVYLSWARQAMEGQLTFINKFTIDSQPSLTINLFFIFVGKLAGVTGISPAVLFRLISMVSAGIFVPICFSLIRLLGVEGFKARLALIFVISASGLGWLFFGFWNNGFHLNSPVDLWQPEAITFLCFYVVPTFPVATVLILSSLYCLLQAEKTGEIKWASYAGIHALIIGNIHSYDYLHIFIVWSLYFAVKSIINRSVDWRTVRLTLIAVIISLPSVIYQYYVYKSDPIFNSRANSYTLSPNFIWYLIGYGVPLIGSILLLIYQRVQRIKITHLFLICWVIGGFLAAYLPVAFQRKMIMGTHIPIAILFGFLFYDFINRCFPTRKITIAWLVVVFTAFGNLFWVGRDIYRLAAFQYDPLKDDRVYLSKEEMNMLDWVNQNLPSKAKILAPVSYSAYIPAYTGRFVYCAHWSETPRFTQRRQLVSEILDKNIPINERLEQLNALDIQYLIVYNNPQLLLKIDGNIIDDFKDSGLKLLYQNREMSIYEKNIISVNPASNNLNNIINTKP